MSRKRIRQYPDAKGSEMEVPGYGIIYATGTTVPTDATAGYAPGCIFQDLDGAQGAQFFINEGSNTSCDFNAIGTGATLSSLTVTTLTATTAAITNMSLSGVLTAADGATVRGGTSSGLTVMTAANQKLGVWGATPIIQPSGTGELLGLSGNAATAANATNMTSNGNVGTKAYSFNDVVKALKQAGALASS